MVSFELTREASDLLKLLYGSYVFRRAEGIGRSEAVFFGSVEDVHAEYLDKMSPEDIFEICRELKRAKCISGLFADNTLYEIELTDDAIVYGEQTFKRNISELHQWISALKGLLPV